VTRLVLVVFLADLVGRCCLPIAPGDGTAFLRGRIDPPASDSACRVRILERRTRAEVGVFPVEGAFQLEVPVSECPDAYVAELFCGGNLVRVVAFDYPREASRVRPLNLGPVH